MKVEMIDLMGDDKTVVNSARVSFANVVDEFGPKDKKLLAYLARHDHWTPFAHVQAQFRIRAPVFVARQLVKHQVGMVWNEQSRRYIDLLPEYHIPKAWRKRADNKKQGSSDETIEYDVSDTMKLALDTYNNLLKLDVAPEMARMVLPQNMMTEWYWSGTLMAFARVCNLRCKDDTQAETREISWLIDDLAKNLFPTSWKALRYE